MIGLLLRETLDRLRDRLNMTLYLVFIMASELDKSHRIDNGRLPRKAVPIRLLWDTKIREFTRMLVKGFLCVFYLPMGQFVYFVFFASECAP